MGKFPKDYIVTSMTPPEEIEDVEAAELPKSPRVSSVKPRLTHVPPRISDGNVFLVAPLFAMTLVLFGLIYAFAPDGQQKLRNSDFWCKVPVNMIERFNTSVLGNSPVKYLVDGENRMNFTLDTSDWTLKEWGIDSTFISVPMHTDMANFFETMMCRHEFFGRKLDIHKDTLKKAFNITYNTTGLPEPVNWGTNTTSFEYIVGDDVVLRGWRQGIGKFMEKKRIQRDDKRT